MTLSGDPDMTPAQSAAEKCRLVKLTDIVRDAMLDAGEAGLTTAELQFVAGPSAVRRLFDLKAEGYDYRREYVSTGLWRYTLTRRPDEGPQVRGIPDAGSIYSRRPGPAARVADDAPSDLLF